MKNIIFDFVKLANGETMAYRKLGSGPKNLLLIHGNMSSSKHWDTVMESMPEEFTTYAVDLRGFGESSYESNFNSLRELADDVKLFVDEVALDKFTIAGWSTGGGVAMYFAVDYGYHLEKMILIESVGIAGYPIFKKDENFQPVLTEFLTSKEEIEEDPVQVLPILKAYEDKNRDLIRSIWDSTIYIFNKPEETRYEAYIDEILKQRNLVDIDYSLVHFNISNRTNGVDEGSGLVSEINTPTLIIQGEDDLVVPKEMGIEISNSIKGSYLELLEKGGHAPMTDDLDRFMDIILNFIN